MALHTSLPIYKVTYDLLIAVTRMTKDMPRDFKASIGGKLREECVELVVLIYRANSACDKVPHLRTLLERLQVTELMLRLARDMRLIGTKHYAEAVQLTDTIGKQANGWRKHSASSPAA